MSEMNAEQQKALQEKVKNMSPEELKEFQKQQCIFCQIISGKVPSQKVYEDDKCFAVLDINPANKGHILLLPKEHYAIMPQIPEDIISHLFIVSKYLSQAQLKGFKAQGTTVFVANGLAAGQRAQHFMIHLIPRFEDDGLTVLDVPQKPAKEEDLQKLRETLINKINQVFGLKKETIIEKKSSNVPEGHKKSEAFSRESEKLPKEGLGNLKDSQKGLENQKDSQKKKEPEAPPEEAPPAKVEKKKSAKKTKKKTTKKKETEPIQKKEGSSLDDIADLFK